MRLIRATVQGLLGRFTHSIDFPEDWSFVILHGPNGVGKTKILELVAAAGTGSFRKIAAIPFETATLYFSTGDRLAITKLNDDGRLPGMSEGEEEGRIALDVSLSPASGDSAIGGRWEMRNPRVTQGLLRIIERDFPVERIADDLWRDYHSEEMLDTAQVVELYGRARGIERDQRSEIPEEVSDFIETLDVHLIETQRLLSQRLHPTRSRGRAARHPSTVMHFSDDLTRRLREALATNSRRSQQLDRTFPRRVLEGPTPAEATTDRIQVRYDEQARLRRRLAEIAILDAAPDLPLPDRDLDDWERRVLWTYLNDTDEKLATFQGLLDRLDLLSSIVNSRFLYKELHIDRESGFRFEDDRGGLIPPSSLSSGEQHELVLVYDLLFNVDSGSLVLIDEPEISLHVAWQQGFLDDLGEIARLASLRFMLATHSPQLINKWWDRTVALEPEMAP